MSVLLIAEHNNKNLKPLTLNAITAASKIDVEVHVLVAGSGSESVAKEVAAIPLVKKVLHCDSPNYQNYLPENLAPLVTKNADKYDHIVASANTFGKNFMPRVAAALDTSQVSDVIKEIWHFPHVDVQKSHPSLGSISYAMGQRRIRKTS